jgi:hypothetical protein
MVSFGSLFRLIKSHSGLVSVNATSRSLLGLLLVSSGSHLGDHIGLIRSPFGLLLVVSQMTRPKRDQKRRPR